MMDVTRRTNIGPVDDGRVQGNNQPTRGTAIGPVDDAGEQQEQQLHQRMIVDNMRNNQRATRLW